MHETTYTIIGALIIFITFIVKEAFRENLKDLSDSLSAADNAYAAYDRNDMIVEMISGLENRVALLGDTIEGRKQGTAEYNSAVAERDRKRVDARLKPRGGSIV